MKKINAIFVLAVAASFILGWQLGYRNFNIKWQNFKPIVQIVNQEPQSLKVDFTLFWQTWDLISKEYIDKKALDPQKLYYGAIQGMVAALGDPYTVFLPPDSQKATKEQLSGSFDGVGIQLGFNKDKRLVVIAPLKDTPADKAGIKAGDLIVSIDKKNTTNITLPDAVVLIRGKRGTTVTLTIFRDGDTKTRDIKLTRDNIVVKSVEFQSKKTPSGKIIAYIRLSSFGEKTDQEWDMAVSDALASAPQGVIIDVRNNPGGLLDSAVYIASEFLNKGAVVLQEDAKGKRDEQNVVRMGKMLKLPLVVLINKGSASASEILAGAIQDRSRGKLVGDISFGKGTIQSAQDLPQGTGIHITTARWLTPNGRWIHNIGLTPDIKIDEGDDPTKDLQLIKALELLDK